MTACMFCALASTERCSSCQMSVLQPPLCVNINEPPCAHPSIRPVLDVKEDLVRSRITGGLAFAPPTYRPASPTGSNCTRGGEDAPAATPAITIQYEAVLPAAPAACFSKAARWADDASSRRQGQGSPSRDPADCRFPGPQVQVYGFKLDGRPGPKEQLFLSRDNPSTHTRIVHSL